MRLNAGGIGRSVGLTSIFCVSRRGAETQRDAGGLINAEAAPGAKAAKGVEHQAARN